MAGRPPRLDAGPNAGREPVAEIIARFDAAAADFAALARAVAAAGRLDELWTDLLDDPPRTKTYGGAILHVVTHGMHTGASCCTCSVASACRTCRRGTS